MPRSIMVIDDTPAILELYQDLLSDEGYAVASYDRPLRTLAEVERVRPDLIIIDYLMSGEKVGWTLLQMLQASPATAGIPLILCTAATNEVAEIRDQLRQLGVRLLRKPFEIDELVGVVSEALSQPPAGRPAAVGRC